MRILSQIFILPALFSLIAGCGQSTPTTVSATPIPMQEPPTSAPTVTLTAVPPTESPSSSATPKPTATIVSTATGTPPPARVLLPPPTANPEAARYLSGVESVLRHSARVLPEKALGLGDVCDERYVIAFPYLEPDRRGAMNLVVVSLKREPDGTVQEGNHNKIWHIGDEGILNAEGQPIDRWRQIALTDRSVEALVRIQFLVQHPDGSPWYVGVASGQCLEDDLRMIGFFPVAHPQDYTLLFDRYSAEAPLDFWLQDGEQLRRYNWEPWTATLLWTLEDTPGRLVAVEWDENSPDLTGDGIPDLIIQWDVSGEIVRWIYTANGSEFVPVGVSE